MLCPLCNAIAQCACGGIKWKERDLENPLDLVAALPPSLPLCRGSVKGFTVGDKKQDQPEKLAEKSMCRAKPV